MVSPGFDWTLAVERTSFEQTAEGEHGYASLSYPQSRIGLTRSKSQERRSSSTRDPHVLCLGAANTKPLRRRLCP